MSSGDCGATSTQYASVLYAELAAPGFHDTSIECVPGTTRTAAGLLGGLLRSGPSSSFLSLKHVPDMTPPADPAVFGAGARGEE
jgi:hypothetical protein